MLLTAEPEIRCLLFSGGFPSVLVQEIVSYLTVEDLRTDLKRWWEEQIRDFEIKNPGRIQIRLKR